MKSFLPLTSSQRQTILINRNFLWYGKPLKQLALNLNKFSGLTTWVV